MLLMSNPWRIHRITILKSSVVPTSNIWVNKTPKWGSISWITSTGTAGSVWRRNQNCWDMIEKGQVKYTRITTWWMGPQPLKVMIWEAWKYSWSKQRRRGTCHRAIVLCCTQLTCAECTHSTGKGKAWEDDDNGQQCWTLDYGTQVIATFSILFSTFLVQVYLRDRTGSVPDHCNEANIAIKWIKWIFGLPRADKSYVYTILWSTKCTIALRPKSNARTLI